MCTCPLEEFILRPTSNIRSSRTREIIYRAEKKLLQDRVKCINCILHDNEGNLDRSRSRQLSLVTTTTTTAKDRCIEFINKVREFRFTKIKNRQVNKFNRLVDKHGNGRETNAQSRNISNQSQASNSNSNQMQDSGSNNKWVINLSNTPLTPAQESLLSKGPDYAIASNPPNLDYIITIKTACQKLTGQDAEELMADINGLLRKIQAPKPNLSQEESKALAELKRDKDRIILTADKGVAMVVLDKKEYVQKAENLLVQLAYRTWTQTLQTN